MGLTKIRAAQISDIDYKQSARVLTDTNINLSGGAPLVVDGVTLLDIDRVLVKGQTNAAQNGIYRVLIPGTGSDGTWVRSSDADATGEIEAGMIIMVTEGTVYKDTQWKLITNDPIIIGVTPLVFEQNSAFAFGNIYANNTAILANVVGDTLTVTPSNNISMVGNASTKTLTIGVVAAGSNSQVQYNTNGNLNANANFTFSPGNTLLVSNANITTTGFYFGDGSQLTNITAAAGARISSGNSNIALASVDGIGNVSISGVQNVVFFTTDGVSTSGNYFANTGYFAGDPDLKLWANSNIEMYVGTTQVAFVDNNEFTISAGNLLSGNIFVNSLQSPDSTFIDVRDGIQGSEVVLSGNLFADGVVTEGNVSANYFYGNGALLTGIDATSIQNGTSKVSVLSSGGNIQANVAGNEIMLLTTDGANITGNMYATGNVSGNYIFGNGALLTGLTVNAFGNIVPETYWPGTESGESPVVANTSGLLFAVAGNGISFETDPANYAITINAEPNNIDYDLVTQAVTISDDFGNVVSNATSAFDYGSISTTAGLLESLGGILAVGNITTQGNVFANYFIGNGSQLTGLPEQYGNANVAAYLPTYTGNLASLTGNVTTTANVAGAYFVGNGRVLTGLYDNIAANVLPAANVTYNLGSTTRRWNDIWLSNSTIYLGEATITADGANVVISNSITLGNTGVFTAANIVITGPGSGDYGGELQLNAGTSNVTIVGNVAIDVYQDQVRFYETGGNNRGAFIDLALCEDAAATNLLASGSETTFSSTPPENPVQGDVWIDSDTGTQYIYFNDGTSNQWAEMSAQASFETANAALTAVSSNLLPNVSVTYDIGSTGNRWRDAYTQTVSATGNITGGNIIATDQVRGTTLFVSDTANVGSLVTPGPVTATGNVSGGNVIATGQLKGAELDITGNAFIDNMTTTLNIDVGGYAEIIGNVTGGNINTANRVVATGNISGGNVISEGAITAIGNITGAALFDSRGEIRTLPENAKTTAYTLIASDAGKYINSNSNVTVPTSVFSSGESVAVYNNSTGNITLIQASGVTMYNIGTANTGNRTLAQKGIATIFCVGANTFVVGGGGVS